MCIRDRCCGERDAQAVANDVFLNLQHGEYLKDSSASLKEDFDEDVTIDAKCTWFGEKHAEVFKVYKGHNGVLQWLGHFELLELETKVIEQKPDGKDGSTNPGNKVRTTVSYKAKSRLFGKTSETKLTDTVSWTIEQGKVTDIKIEYGDKDALTALLEPDASQAVVKAMFDDWSAGLFKTARADTVAKHFAGDVAIDANTTKPHTYKNTTGFTKYNGHDGIVQWLTFLDELAIEDLQVESILKGEKQGQVVVTTSYGARNIAENNRAPRRLSEVCVWEVVDGKVKGAAWRSRDSEELDALFQKKDYFHGKAPAAAAPEAAAPAEAPAPAEAEAAKV
eukprot:TRINITY_DN741_c0_g1_i3.p1 TRINITY_DN741_c0_g1~~TRINITY_DN741_c0_g1_i3.p1  ORF type:complete len:336 (-),score=105.07 TRINITY_DN741_c0_g1_i3:556-1563(-)